MTYNVYNTYEIGMVVLNIQTAYNERLMPMGFPIFGA